MNWCFITMTMRTVKSISPFNTDNVNNKFEVLSSFSIWISAKYGRNGMWLPAALLQLCHYLIFAIINLIFIK